MPTTDRRLLPIRSFASAGALFAGAMIVPPALGQSDDNAPPGGQGDDRPPVTYQLNLRGSHEFESGFDGGADVSVSRVGGSLGVNIPIDQTFALRLGLATEASVYSFDGSPLPAMFGSAAPIDSAVSNELSALLSIRQNQRMTWLAGGAVELSHELGADTGDAVVGSGLVGAVYAVSETLQVGGVVTVTRDMDGEVFVAGFPSIDWRFADRWRLYSTERGLLSLAHQATDSLAVSLDAGFRRRQFRLDDDGPLPDGIAIDARVPVAIGLRYTPTPQTVFTARAGAFVWQNFEFLNSDDAEVFDDDTDPAAFISLGFTVRF